MVPSATCILRLIDRVFINRVYVDTLKEPFYETTMNYLKKPSFNLYQFWHCAYKTYSVKTWFLKNLCIWSLLPIDGCYGRSALDFEITPYAVLFLQTKPETIKYFSAYFFPIILEISSKEFFLPYLRWFNYNIIITMKIW